MNIDVTPLPGIGVRKDFQTADGRRVGVVTTREGTVDLVVSKADDPDASELCLALSPREAVSLASLLGAPQLLAQLRDELPGLSIRQLPLADTSPLSGRTLGEGRIRARTGTSVVAVIRTGEILAAPKPDFVLAGGDTLIAVGTAEGIEAAAKILHQG